MDWTIRSKDDVTQRTGMDTRDTEAGFLALAGNILRDHRRELISVTLPTGEVLDEAAVRGLVGKD